MYFIARFISDAIYEGGMSVTVAFKQICDKKSTVVDRASMLLAFLAVTLIYGLITVFGYQLLSEGQHFEWNFDPTFIMGIGLIFVLTPWLLLKLRRKLASDKKQ